MNYNSFERLYFYRAHSFQQEFASPLRAPEKAAKALSCTGGTDNVSISDLISKLKEVTVKKDNGCSALEKNTSQGEEEEENIVKGDTSTSANQHNASNTTGHNMMVPNVRENLTEAAANESRKVRHLNPRSAATLRGEVKKISTGRGFTIAYQYLKAEVSRNKTLENDSEDFSIIYGYNEDEENCDPQNKLEQTGLGPPQFLRDIFIFCFLLLLKLRNTQLDLTYYKTG